MSKYFLSILLLVLSFQFLKTHAQTNQSCNTYLNIPNSQSYATIGDLSVSGNKITVEGLFSRDSAFTPEGFTSLNLVSKHWTPADVNYLLRVDRAEITTSNGYFTTGDICSTFNDRIYHVAMVYDGIKLKFYRNGFLMSQVNCTGNMVQNLWQTTIGATAGSPTSNTSLIGHLNEIRIWNVARTQTEIQNNMEISLPNPASQTGLLAYYIFDNLINKQGNTVHNATLFGSAVINTTTPTCTYNPDSCFIPAISCTEYLKIPNSQSYATIGNLNVTGNKITVEGVFSRDSAFTPEGFTSLNLVSKHWTPLDVNYLLRADRAEITTSNGYFTTGGICSTFNKKTYHVAMVYDGIKLKFYRNGFLMSQVNCTGNMVQNFWPTTIGATAGSPTTNTTLIGLLNEVRIWNVARTQDEIKQYMNVSLPNPTLQTGLLAYYSFNNLLNKQGNSMYNATLFSGSSINVSNPNCLLQIDSCATVLPITITSFSTKINNNKSIQLNWQTEEESGIYKYIIQRSISTQGGFVSIGSVIANGNRSNNYTFIDYNTKTNIRYYYRLLILENTGESKYSIVRNEKIIEKGFYASVFPNPTTDKLTLQVNNYTGILNIKVLNSIGQTILINKSEVTNSSALFNLPFSDQPKGSYWIYIKTDNDVIIKKVIKL